MNCAQCEGEIPDGEQTVVWGPPGQPVSVVFICPKCSDKMVSAGLLKQFDPLAAD